MGIREDLVNYVDSDFPQSRRWNFGGDSAWYRKQAANHANKVAEKIRCAVPFVEILRYLAEAREAIAITMATANPEQFGLARAKRSATHLDAHNHAIWVQADRNLMEFNNGPLALDFDYPLPASVPRISRQTYYETLTRTKIPATRISKYLSEIKTGPYVFGVGVMVLEHTLPENVDGILNDVLQRLEELRKDPESTSSRVQFLTCLYGYYQAMPYLRGSASIGSMFFAGCFLGLFEEKLGGLPPDPDLSAMTALDQNEFISQFLEPTRLALLRQKLR